MAERGAGEGRAGTLLAQHVFWTKDLRDLGGSQLVDPEGPKAQVSTVDSLLNSTCTWGVCHPHPQAAAPRGLRVSGDGWKAAGDAAAGLSVLRRQL